MRTSKVFLVAVLFSALTWVSAHATTYYVSALGNDQNNGTSTATPWKTISKINGFLFSDGDSVLLRRGDVFGDSSFRSPKVNNFTLADYGVGAKPVIDGDKVQPINVNASPVISNLTIRNIDIGGQDWSAVKGANVWIQHVNGVTVDGVDGDGFRNGNTSVGKNALTIINCSGAIYVKNCTLQNWGPSNLPAATEDFIAIVLYEIPTGTYEIFNNLVHNVNADCIQIYETKAVGKIYNNVLYNAGEDTIDVKGTYNCDIYDNEHYRELKFTGQGGSGSGGLPTFIVIHEGGVTTSAQNVNVMRNRFHDSNIAVGIKLGNTATVNIEQNCFQNVASAVYIGDHCKDTKIHHNVIKNPVFRSDTGGVDAGGIFENNSFTGTQIYNNTLYNATGSAKTLITIAFSSGSLIHDNVGYQENSASDAYTLNVLPMGTKALVQNNCWFNSMNSARVKYWGVTYSDAQQTTWLSGHPGEFFGNPLLVDPSAGNLSLSPSTSCTMPGGVRGAVVDPMTSPCPPSVITPVPEPQPPAPGGVHLE